MQDRISPRGVPVERGSWTARNKLRAGSRSPALRGPATVGTARPAPITVACAGDIPTPPPMVLSRPRSKPYAGRRAHRRTGMVESVTAAPVSHAPPTHAASDSEMLTPIPTVTSTAAPLSPRLSYLDVATNAVPTPPTVTTPPAKGPDQTSSKPRVPSSPGVKGPAPSLEGKASAELAVAPVTGVSLDEPCSLAIRVDHMHTVRSCLLYTSPSPRDLSTSRMPSSA